MKNRQNDRARYVIGNMKMNVVTRKECDNYLRELNERLKNQPFSDDMSVIVCPPVFFVEHFADQLPSNVFLGSQNVFWEDRGSYTGESSAFMMKDAGVKLVLCGHSERRSYLHETDDMVSKKVAKIIACDMIAAICVGETAEELERGEADAVIERQLLASIANVSAEQLAQIVIAYEPRFAIGTGIIPSTDDIVRARILIRKILIKKYGLEAAESVSILYGGSVKASLMEEVCFRAGMDGVLVGKESLNADEFMLIIDSLANAD